MNGGGLGVHLGEAAGEDDAQLGDELGAEFAEALGLGGLALEDGDLAGDLVEDVVDAREIAFGGLEAELGEALFGFEAGDAGRFFDDGAAVEGLGAEELTDALLADDGVAVATEAGAEEDVLDVAQTADLAVQKVFALAGAEEAARDGDFAGAGGGAAELAATDLEDDAAVFRGGFGVRCGFGAFGGLGGFAFGLVGLAGLCVEDGFFGVLGDLFAEGVLVPIASDVGGVSVHFVGVGRLIDGGVHEGEGDLGHAGGAAFAGAREDDVFHLEAAQRLGGLFAEDPGDGVGDVGLAAAVGSDDGGDAVTLERDLRAITEGLEAEDLDLF